MVYYSNSSKGKQVLLVEKSACRPLDTLTSLFLNEVAQNVESMFFSKWPKIKEGLSAFCTYQVAVTFH